MDSNVVGRYYTGPTGAGPSIQRIVVRDLTAETEGNAVGIGMADVVLRRAVEKMDAHKTYMNCITAKTPEGARVALTVDTDREALSVAIACCLKVEPPDGPDRQDPRHQAPRAAVRQRAGAGGRPGDRALRDRAAAQAIEFDAEGMLASAME